MPHPLSRLYRYTARYRPSIAAASVYSVLNKFFDVLPELLIGVAVDVVVQRRDSFLARLGVVEPETQLVVLAVLTVLIWLGESLFQYLYDVEWRTLAQNLQHDLRMEAYVHVQKLELSWFEKNRSGNLQAVLNDDINQMERFFNGGANDLIQVLVGTTLVGAVFFTLTTPIAVLALIPVPFILIGAFWFQARLAPRYAATREAAGAMAARLSNNLQGIATVKAYAAESFEAQQIALASDRYREKNREAIRWSAAITPVIRVAILAGFTVTLLYGGQLALRGELGVGSYSMLVYLTQRLLWPLTRLAEMTDLYQRSMASIQRVMDLLETPVGIGYEGRPLAATRGEIQFQNLNFSYPGAQTPTLLDINLHIRPGQTVALVGSTGSGKSTLTRLLLRLYAAPPGAVLLDGQALDGLDLQDLRRQIGYVAQDAFLTDGTVAENIAYGQPEIARERVIAAAKAAEAHAFVMELADGYDTPVGERGQKLSGGQRQRLALARAILKDPPILVLDEATSAVDNETEAAIQRSLERLVVGRTSLIVAHRLSTVRSADVIYVMERGRIAEAGTHQELVEKGAIYAALWRLQTGEPA